jgi:TnpA family transposase
MEEASKSRQDLVDIINSGIEELIHDYYELPSFKTIEKEATRSRAVSNRQIYQKIYAQISKNDRLKMDGVLKVDPESNRSLWNEIRQDARKATLDEINNIINKLLWLQETTGLSDTFEDIPYVKISHLAAEAKTLDVARVRAVTLPKRYSLIAALTKVTIAHTIDDICDIMIKKLGSIHNKGKEALKAYNEKNQETTDAIVTSYKNIHDCVSGDESPEEKILQLENHFFSNPDLVEYSKSHSIYGGKNYFRFLLTYFRNYRVKFFRILGSLNFVSTSSDRSLEKAISFALSHKNSRVPWLSIEGNSMDVSWIPDNWWYLVTGLKRRKLIPQQIDRKQFELCLFSQITQELKSADLCVEGSEKYSDFRNQLISWKNFHKKLSRYSNLLGLPADEDEFILYLQKLLAFESEKLDRSYPQDQEFSIDENGDLKLKRLKAKSKSDCLDEISQLISERMPKRNILDILIDTQKILNWCRVFRPVSGFKSKLKDPITSYIVTNFCYGFNLGPVQTSRSLPILNRKQIEWINRRHVTEEMLQDAIDIFINAYNKFSLPKYWGDTSSVSADGTRWDVYENNLLAEYHVRYGNYGGIGYYHVTDTYIAFFSRFISCGVFEGHHILDPFFQNKTDVRPDTVHSDTHGQSLAIFGLSFLLGIQLMPRIAKWKNLKIFKSDFASYKNIEPVFTKEKIDWELIRKHLFDMIRIAISIQEGKIMPSTILRRLGSYSRKNKLYFAFQELGKVIRSAYLLKYLRKPDLRRKVNHATTVSEAFNDFIQFVTFGNQGIIAENTRDQQRKIIKYGHLVANALIFMNVYDQSTVMNDLLSEGVKITPEIATDLNPYRKNHINRFGAYFLDEERECPEIDYMIQVADENFLFTTH